MVRVKIIIALAGLGLVSACASSQLEQETQRIVDQFNAERETAESIARGEGFPVLSATPQQIPERHAASNIQAQETGLLEARDALLVYVRDDTVRAIADRQIVEQIMDDGEVLDLGLEEAADVLRQRIASDQQLIFEQLSLPVPKLGGVPPKHLR